MATEGDRNSTRSARTVTTVPIEVCAPPEPPLPSGGPGAGEGRGEGDLPEAGDTKGPPHLIIPPEEWARIAEELELAPRELEVVQLLFDGKIESQIAWELDIAISTVHTYIKRMYAKADATNHCELLVCIFKEHLHPTEPPEGEEGLEA